MTTPNAATEHERAKPRYEDVRWIAAQLMNFEEDLCTHLFKVEDKLKAARDLATIIATSFANCDDHPRYREDEK